MELFDNLALGFGVRLHVSKPHLLLCRAACWARLIGVLPGIGPVATIAMLLPATFALPPESALIMLAGIYSRRPVRRLHHGHFGQLAGRMRPRW